jgi:hypothetical protein
LLGTDRHLNLILLTGMTIGFSHPPLRALSIHASQGRFPLDGVEKLLDSKHAY